MDLSKNREDADVAELTAAYNTDVKIIRDWYALQRRLHPGNLGAEPRSAPPEPKVDATNNANGKRGPKGGMSEVTRKNVAAFLETVESWSADEFTFPEINRKLESEGRGMTRDQLRTVWDHVHGRPPVFQIRERSGSVAALFSRKPSPSAPAQSSNGNQPVGEGEEL